jgi:hypothetical protein
MRAAGRSQTAEAARLALALVFRWLGSSVPPSVVVLSRTIIRPCPPAGPAPRLPERGSASLVRILFFYIPIVKEKQTLRVQ